MDLIYNEKSFSTCYPDKISASQGLKRSITVAKDLTKLGYRHSVRTVTNFRQLELAPGYSVADWMNDQTARSTASDKELFRFFCTSCTKSPYLEDYHQEANLPPEIEYQYDNEPALGLTLAHLWNTVSLSLDGDARFQNFVVYLSKLTLDNSGEINATLCESHTLICEAQIDMNRSIIKQKLLDNLNCGADIIACAQKYFPNILFCDAAEKQVRALSGSEEYFEEIIKHLNIFDQEKASGAQPFRPRGLTYAPGESNSTEDNKKLYKMREFRCPDGMIRYFGAHSKLMSSNKRIHLIADYSDHLGNEKVLIGYVGDHLPTLQY
jgi:hypothetical protein